MDKKIKGRGPRNGLLALTGVALATVLVAPIAGSASISDGGFSVKAVNSENEEVFGVAGAPGTGVSVPVDPEPVEDEVSNVMRSAGGLITIGQGGNANSSSISAYFDLAKTGDTAVGDGSWSDLRKLLGENYVATSVNQFNPGHEFRYLMKSPSFGMGYINHGFEVSLLNSKDEILYTTYKNTATSAAGGTIHRSYKIGTDEVSSGGYGRVQVNTIVFRDVNPQLLRDFFAAPGSKLMVSHNGVDIILPINENLTIRHL